GAAGRALAGRRDARRGRGNAGPDLQGVRPGVRGAEPGHPAGRSDEVDVRPGPEPGPAVLRHQRRHPAADGWRPGRDPRPDRAAHPRAVQDPRTGQSPDGRRPALRGGAHRPADRPVHHDDVDEAGLYRAALEGAVGDQDVDRRGHPDAARLARHQEDRGHQGVVAGRSAVSCRLPVEHRTAGPTTNNGHTETPSPVWLTADSWSLTAHPGDASVELFAFLTAEELTPIFVFGAFVAG